VQNIIEMPECNYCHSTSLELSYSKASGVIVECGECGYATKATNEHIESDVIVMKIAG